MSVAEITPWQRAGCSDRCARLRAHVGSRAYSEMIEVHAPEDHEAYGEHVLAQRLHHLRALPVRTGPLSLDPPTQTVTVDGEPVHLTETEFRILSFLAANLETVCPHQDIGRAVWGESAKHDAPKNLSHTLTVNVTRLRQKLGTAGRLVETCIGRGYRLRGERT